LSKYKVVIPTAGLGTRVRDYSKNINKALLTIGQIPVIAHIIESFPHADEFVIILGYKGDMVKAVVEQIFPHVNKTFVTVDDYEGPKSGLGYTLLSAESELQCPFVFCSNDTIAKDVIDFDPTRNNWMAYYVLDAKSDASKYRTITLDDVGNVASINPKDAFGARNAYIGLCGVKDYQLFWKHMHESEAVPVGESYALKSLTNIKGVEIREWYDTGNVLALEAAKKKFRDTEHNILEKDGEAIWFHDDKVIKFSVDKKFISDRVERMLNLPIELLPQLLSHNEYCYTYELIEGTIMSDVVNDVNVIKVLDEVKDKMWNVRSPRITGVDQHKVMDEFYRIKTYKRVSEFYKNFEMTDKVDIINDLDPNGNNTKDLLDRVPWKFLTNDYHISRFHGDFHNENIIIKDDGTPGLLDWRQNFCGDREFGDAYYDFAKFKHGLIVPHKSVHEGKFMVKNIDDNHAVIDIDRPHRLVEVEKAFDEWLKSNRYDVKKVDYLTALIYLNIAALHDWPYVLFLYYLGKNMLTKLLKKDGLI